MFNTCVQMKSLKAERRVLWWWMVWRLVAEASGVGKVWGEDHNWRWCMPQRWRKDNFGRFSKKQLKIGEDWWDWWGWRRREGNWGRAVEALSSFCSLWWYHPTPKIPLNTANHLTRFYLPPIARMPHKGESLFRWGSKPWLPPRCEPPITSSGWWVTWGIHCVGIYGCLLISFFVSHYNRLHVEDFTIVWIQRLILWLRMKWPIRTPMTRRVSCTIGDLIWTSEMHVSCPRIDQIIYQLWVIHYLMSLL